MSIMLLSFIVTIFSCKSDDDSVDIKNRVIINGKTFELVSGFFDSDPDPALSADSPPLSGYQQELLFIGPGLTMNNATGIVSGSGNAIVFDPFTTDDTIESGNFELPVPYEEKLGFLLDAFSCEGYDSSTEECDVEYEGDSGTLTVAISGGVYTITFIGKMTYEDDDENEVSTDVDLFFEGTLTGVDL